MRFWKLGVVGVAAALAMSGGARAGTVATWNYGEQIAAAESSPVTSALISIDITDEDENVIVTLFNRTVTSEGNFTFTADSASDPNWATAISFLNNGENHELKLHTEAGLYTDVSDRAILLPISLPYPTIFSSAAAFTAQPITSLTLTITDFKFTEAPDPIFGGSVYGVDYSGALSFNTGSVAAATAVPAPVALIGGVAGLAVMGIRRQR